MKPNFAHQLDALAAWRRGLERRADDLAKHLSEHDLDEGEAGVQALRALSKRLATDRLSVAFVAEFSRGKSELINAIFFADAGQRVLPATPGRTTMCPVEIGFDAGEPPQLSLLPIETRLEDTTLAEWRERGERWKRIKLDTQNSAKLAESLQEVMRTKAVTVARARDLGLWHEDRPDDNPPVMAEGLVEIPAWRHAAINYPHPLLRRGLVVLDTPGLNAIGAEPELTLSLLPQANAVVYILGADTGVTKSDLAVWRDHLSGPAMTRLVALNKIDTLADPMLSAEGVAAQIESQRQSTALQLGVKPEHVFPVSARQALQARVEGKRDLLKTSRLLDLEQALSGELLPRRHDVLSDAAHTVALGVEQRAGRRVQDLRRGLAEQLSELRSLRGKSGGKTNVMVQRVKNEVIDFERGAARATAVRAIHVRMLRAQLVSLASASLRDEFEVMKQAMEGSLFNLGGKKAFVALFNGLRERIGAARKTGVEAQTMLEASFKQLNSEFGFALTLSSPPDLDACAKEVQQLEHNYSHYLGLGNALRMGDKRFMEQFRRMLMAKLRVSLESAANEVEQWHRAASSQLDAQLRDRRNAFTRRQEALERIVGAQDELETRITELEAQDQRWLDLSQRTQGLVHDLRRSAANRPKELDIVLPSVGETASASASGPRPGASSSDTDNGADTEALAFETRPQSFDVRPQAQAGFHVDSHTEAVHINTVRPSGVRASELAA
jgi:hypothetical protein